MTRGDYQTFYPYAMGIGAGYPGNFESSFDEDENDPSLDDRNDNQESTEFENEHTQVPEVAQPEEQPQPGKCGFWDFRNKVKQKKAELKAQYGKGHFELANLTACGIKPLDPSIDPTLFNVPCTWDCSKSRNSDKWCCKENVIKARKRAERRDEIARWFACRNQNGPWKRGWRYQWRKFVKNGGLKQLAQQCKAEMQGSTPIPTSPIQTGLVEAGTISLPADISSMTCQQIANKFGIIPGKKWGTAPDEVRAEWARRGCTKESIETGIDPVRQIVSDMPDASQRALPADTEKKSDNTKMFLVVGVVLVVAIAGYFLMKTLKGK